MPFVPTTDAERTAMLERVGAQSTADLFEVIPPAVRFPKLRLAGRRAELTVARRLRALAGANRPAAEMACFLGAGAYHHFVPAAVRALVPRGEFLTSYTPYQPEISQGTLQTTFEFQSLVCDLLDMDVANAGMYDGSTALAEAVLMAERITRRTRVVLAGRVDPEYRNVVATYVAERGTEVVTGAVTVGDEGLPRPIPLHYWTSKRPAAWCSSRVFLAASATGTRCARPATAWGRCWWWSAIRWRWGC